MFMDRDNRTNEYCIEGPLGKGLQINKSGTYLAFSAGTGILAFLDVVGFLITAYKKPLSHGGLDFIRNSDFKFVLFSSFTCETETIGT